MPSKSQRRGATIFRGKNVTAHFLSRLAAEEITLGQLKKLAPRVWWSLRQSEPEAAIVYNIYKALNEKGWYISDMQRRSGVHRNTVHLVLKNGGKVNVGTLQKLASVFSRHIRDFLITPFDDDRAKPKVNVQRELAKKILEEEVVHIESEMNLIRQTLDKKLEKATHRLVAALRSNDR